MKFRLWMGAASGALLAAIGAASVSAAATTGPAAPDYNTENGVHAVPSGHVAVQSLPAPTGAKSAASPATAHIARRSSGVHVRTATAVPRAPLTLQLAQADPGPEPSLGGATDTFGMPAPDAVPASDAPAPIETIRDPDPVTAAASDATPASVQTEPATLASAATEIAQAAPDKAPDAPVAAPVMTVASTAADTAPASLAQADPDAEGPEEARAYGHAEPALARTDASATGGAVLQQVRDERPAPDSSVQQHVAFPRASAEAAAAFANYMQRAGGIDAKLASGTQVASALETASAYDIKQLDEGMIAYGAIAALQSPRFVYAVMDAAAEDGARHELIDQLLANPQSASRIPGAAEAAAMADAAVVRQARPVVAAGKALKQAAYDVQHSSWSTAKVPDPTGRLARAKSASAGRIAARDGDVARLLTQVSTAGSADEAGGGAPFTPVSVRSVALAALAILDGASGGDPGRLSLVTTEDTSAQCLKMAKLNLFQCLSVAGPEYEDVFCLGQHAVLDTGQCVAAAARPSGELLMSALPRRSDDESRVMVPIGGDRAR